jgi:WD40 repeat protein
VLAENYLYLQNFQLGQVINRLGESPDCKAMLFSPDGQKLMTVEADRVQIWNVATGMLESTLTAIVSGFVANDAHNFKVGVVNPDSSLLTVGAADGQIYVWSLDDGTLIGTLQPNYPAMPVVDPVAISFNTNNTEVMGFYRDGVVKWKLGSLKQLSITKYNQPLASEAEAQDFFANSAGGQMLADCDNGYALRIYSLVTGRLKARLEHAEAKILSLAFSADGQTLACTTDEGMVEIYSLQLDPIAEQLLNQNRAKDLGWLQEAQQAQGVSEAELDWLRFSEELLHWKWLYAVEIGDMAASEFDIELEGIDTPQV